jgi:protein-S-isoprenylcysteine O-methyltransferase Ste14
MQPPPKNKNFWLVPFVVHATRGIIREQNARRWTMFSTLLVALLLLFAGSTVLQPMLGTHPAWFILFWFVVAWLTLAAILLALFDILIVRAQAKAARKMVRSGFSAPQTSDAPPERDNGVVQ